jgi:pimeloyl-ACP methyl ester carboxylesterase
MNISALWEKSTLLLMSRSGIKAERLSMPPYEMSALTLKSDLLKRVSKSQVKSRVVCVHGLGSSAAAYASLMPHLVGYWREVWAPSAPSHGMSPPLPIPSRQEEDETDQVSSSKRFQSMIYNAWERCLLELSHNEPIDLLGVSLGGAIVIRFTARYPDRVSSVMLCSPAGAILDEADIEHLKSVFSMDLPGDGLRFLKTLYHRLPWWSRLLAPLVRFNLSRPEAQNLINDLTPGDGLKPNEFKDLNPPVLLVWGKRERVLPPTSLENLLKYAPKELQLIQPDTFSHTPQKESPKELAQYLITFQERVELSQAKHT